MRMVRWAAVGVALALTLAVEAAPSLTSSGGTGGSPSPSGGGSSGGTSPSITATASNPKDGDLAGTRAAPAPAKNNSKMGPDDSHFVSGATMLDGAPFSLAGVAIAASVGTAAAVLVL